MKKCTKCNIITDKFEKNKSLKDGLAYWCKDCRKSHKRTKTGLITKIYSAQRSTSKRRGYPKPCYTNLELREWLMAQPLYHELYKKWVESGYDTNLVPSVDRKNDCQGYSFENIQLMTWEENNKKSYKTAFMKKINGSYSRISKRPKVPVVQKSKDNKVVNYYKSITEAAKAVGVHHGNISKCCRGKTKSSGGFNWEYRVLK